MAASLFLLCLLLCLAPFPLFVPGTSIAFGARHKKTAATISLRLFVLMEQTGFLGLFHEGFGSFAQRLFQERAQEDRDGPE